jgi:glycosyltransferase involved in cell wall biosynthesis
MTKHSKKVIKGVAVPQTTAATAKPVAAPLPTGRTATCAMVTRGDRIKFLEITFEHCFMGQDYPNITEWLIVNGSQTQEEAKVLENFLAPYTEKNPKIRLNPWSGKKNIGAYRNEVNDLAVGDYIISFDDDDYYFRDRVSHTVDKMVKNRAELSGVEDQYIYDVRMDVLFYANLPMKNTATNNTFAYTKNFAKTRRYDETKEFAEESSFLNSFPVFQLDRGRIAVQISHTSNTYNKNMILLQGLLEQEGAIPRGAGSTTVSPRPVYDIIPKSDGWVIDKMRALYPPTDDDNDYVIYCGRSNVEWDPASKSLGGSEQAVVEVCKHLVKNGLKVAVYGYINEEKTIDGVPYMHFYKFNPANKFRNLILWRLFGSIVLGLKLKAEKIIIDLHDNHFPAMQIILKYRNKIHKYWFKSNFHKELFERGFQEKIPADKCFIQPNGIRVEEFQKDYEMKRDPFRVVYASSYDRSLVWLLDGFWQMVRRIEPRAELHCYYGIGNTMNPELKKKIEEGLLADGVMNHGRQPVDIVARAKQHATFHLYPCFTDAEIDCISVRESLVAGCIPLLANYGVFKEREGIYMDIAPGNQQSYFGAAVKLVQMMRQGIDMIKVREGMRVSPTITSWGDSANKLVEACTGDLPRMEIVLNV